MNVFHITELLQPSKSHPGQNNNLSVKLLYDYSRSSMARTLMARLPRLFRTRF